MSLTAREIWSRLLDRARQELPEQTFRTWLEPTEPLAIDGDTLLVGAPDQFAADWNESKHADLLAGYGPVALGHPIRIAFRVNEERKTRPQMDLFVAPPAVAPQGETRPPQNQRANTFAPLSDRYTFDHFVIGKSNELAAAAAHAAAQAPGKVYNPLFLYGDTGLGKTHLMQAVAHEILTRKPETRIAFVGTEQFTNELVASIQSRTTQDFRRRYREIDLLLVDDVHFLKGKEATQEEFFHTFNALYEAGRQIILTSDRPPSEIPGLEARLVSRFQWGMVADIELPDLEHRIAILRHKAHLDHLELTIPEDVIRFIAEHIRSSVRELEGSIIKLLAYASLRHREVTVDLAREALRDKLRSGPEANAAPGGGQLDIIAIQNAVAREWGVTADGLKSKTRTKTLTTPRHVGMYLTRELLGTPLVEIGMAFGGRDHSTVIHSIERVTETIPTDGTFAKRVEKLRLLLQSML
ncbi:MAG: chromosomal replication initiator protein DnaA [Gemmatimonadaceae bacterium]|nr:chromosomal replication initiator protein DnaA [Gemmatimonadaceae bacterium]NUQ92236.1 chromosomal replication initiator protein DnaA [Gemmatimonadaceae bacterium]NUR20157.1 chromosomal replication initiator protein DnaA [Gemmatimonadaceae bacterium]